MTTTIAIHINPEDIQRADLGDFATAFSEIFGLVGDKYIDDLRDDHPAVEGWDALLADVKKEVEPQVEVLILGAIHKRLPFEWDSSKPPGIEPER